MIKTTYITTNNKADINYLKNYQLADLLKGLNFLEINSKKEAKRVALFLKENNHFDIFIMSKRLSILKQIYKIYDEVRLVLEINKKNKFTNLKSTLFNNNISTICLPNELINQAIIRNLKLEGIKVIAKVTDEISLYKAILSGADGVLGNDLSKVKINADMVMLPLLVSHRGNHKKYVENSLDAGLEAYKDGADFLEMDVQVTKDNVVVVNHDDNLKRTYNLDYLIKENTYEKLLDANMRKGDKVLLDKLPLLSEFDQIIPNDFIFLIEAKTETKEEAFIIGEEVNKLKRNFQVMTFYPWTLEPLAEVVRNNKTGFLIDYKYKGDIFNKMLRMVNKLNSGINPYYGSDNLEYRNEFQKRMIEYAPWGIKLNELKKALNEGFDKLNSDYIDQFKGIIKKVVVKDHIVYKMFKDGKKVILSDDTGKIINYDVNILFDNPLGLVFSKDELIDANKKGTGYVYLTHTFKFLDQEYKMASDLIKIEVI